MRESNIIHLLLRIAIAFAFLYPPVSAYFAPYDWIGYFPNFVRGIVPDPMLLGGWGVLEAIIGLWIISGKRIFIPATLATLLLISIVLFNTSQFEILFRDLSLALIAATLALWSYERDNTRGRSLQ